MHSDVVASCSGCRAEVVWHGPKCPPLHKQLWLPVLARVPCSGPQTQTQTETLTPETLIVLTQSHNRAHRSRGNSLVLQGCCFCQGTLKLLLQPLSMCCVLPSLDHTAHMISMSMSAHTPTLLSQPWAGKHEVQGSKMFDDSSTEVTSCIILHVVCLSLKKLRSPAICISVCASVTLACTAVCVQQK